MGGTVFVLRYFFLARYHPCNVKIMAYRKYVEIPKYGKLYAHARYLKSNIRFVLSYVETYKC